LSSLNLKPPQLAEFLNLHIAEVEGVKDLERRLNKVIVAEIVEIKPHPQADKLQIPVVDTGKGKREIVCGADNIAQGQKVPLALPGAILAGGVEIKAVTIRGVKSEGMLCSEKELGIGEDAAGILILPAELKPGVSLPKTLDLSDVIFEIENKSLTHRPDLFSHLGFARQLRGALGGELKRPPLEREEGEIKKELPLQVRVKDNKLCPRYMAQVFADVKIKPSPLWLQNKLRKLGLRPINNVVDITNYIIMELGQPLHAFDYDKLMGGKIIVRRAKKGEKIVTIDVVEGGSIIDYFDFNADVSLIAEITIL